MASRYSCTIKKFKLPPHELPVDFSFLKFTSVKEIQPDMVQSGRICTPLRTDDGKFLAKTIWLNNNKLKDFCDLVEFVGRVLDNPELLTWLDLSFNRISEIDNSILQFQNLKILYLHGNRLTEIKEIVKLKGLKLLRTLVSHGNPVYSKKNYRLFVISVIPQASLLKPAYFIFGKFPRDTILLTSIVLEQTTHLILGWKEIILSYISRYGMKDPLKI